MHGLAGWMHLSSALAALALGGVVIGLRKGTPLHRVLGLTYVLAMLIVNASALSLYNLNGHFGPFHALALVSLACVLMGLGAALLRQPGWLIRHYRWMARSYLGLLAAAAAEALVRIPALHVNNAPRAFTFGIGSAIAIALLGVIALPRLQRTAERYQESHPAILPGEPT